MEESRDMNTLAQYKLPDGNNIRMGFVPDNLRMTLEQFETLWELQPVEPQQIRMSGRMVDIPTTESLWAQLSVFRTNGCRRSDSGSARTVFEMGSGSSR